MDEIRRLHDRMAEFEQHAQIHSKARAEALPLENELQYPDEMMFVDADQKGVSTPGLAGMMPRLLPSSQESGEKGRRLSLFSDIKAYNSQSPGSGCAYVDLVGVASSDALHIDLDLGIKSCGNYRCPPCFIIKSIVDVAGGETPKLILRNCSNMLLSKDIRLGTGKYHDAV